MIENGEKFTALGSGAVVRYACSGVGQEVVVLLHGYGASMEVWDDFAGQLGKTHKVITLDLPGSGFSTYNSGEEIPMQYMAQVTAELLEKLEVKKYHLAGHSMGGAVAVALAEIAPAAAIETLTLFHSLPVGSSIKGRSSTLREMNLIEAGKKEMLTTINPNKGFAEVNARRCADAIEEKIEQFMLTDDEALVATLKGLLNCPDRTAVLQQCSFAVLFVFGDSDPYIPTEAVEMIEEKLPDAKIEVIANCAHHAFIEQRDQAIEILRDFFAAATQK